MRRLIVLLMIFTLFGCTGKKEHKNVFDPSYDGDKGGIWGNVTLSGSSNPDYNDIKITLQKGKNDLPFTTTVDSRGSFKFHAPEGTFNLKVAKDGYTGGYNSMWQLDASYEQITVTKGVSPVLEGPKLYKILGNVTVTGTLKDKSTQSPIAATIAVYRIRSESMSSLITQTTSDSNGSFTFTVTNTYYNESLSIGTFDKTDNVTKFNITDTTMQLGTILM